MAGPVKREYLKRVSRPRKHHSEEERAEARRASARKHYKKHRETILAKAKARRVPSYIPKTHGPMFVGPLREHNVRRPRKERSNKGMSRGKTYGPMFIGPLGPKNTRRPRKERSNKGMSRGPRHTALFE